MGRPERPGQHTADLGGPARSYVPTMLSGTLEGHRIAAAWLEREREHAVGQALIVVPTARHIRRDRYIEAATERTAWVTAARARLLRVMGWHGGPTLLIHPDASTLERFDPNRAVTTLCVVQGHEYDPTAWARARGAHDLTIGADVPTGTIIDAGTATLIERVRTERHWRGLTTRGDRARISAALADARALESSIEPLDLEVWALTTGWRPASAERLRRLAETMSSPNEPRPTVGRHRAELAA